MNGTWVDSLLTASGRASARILGAHDERVRYVKTRAGRLRVVDTGGNKPALVLTPDGPCVIQHYAALIRGFSECFRVVCFDMPGLGFSFPTLAYRFGIAETADVIVELLDALSIARAAFAFTCANGFHAMNLARRYPQRVSHLVLTQTPSFEGMRRWIDRNIPKVLRRPVAGQIVAAVRAESLATHWFDLALPRGSEHQGSFVAQTRGALGFGGCFCLASVVQGLLRSGEVDLRGIQCPTLAIHGDSDHSHRHTDFRSITDLIPHARVVSFQGCGHFPDLERTPAYLEQVQQFVLGST